MIIECVNCLKKFEVNSELIPSNGRTIQCGSCNHVWFYRYDEQSLLKLNNENVDNNTDISVEITKNKKTSPATSKKNMKSLDKKKTLINQNKGTEIIEYTEKKDLTFGKFLSYILVIIISFIALILILDTFKIPLYNFFPNLEFLLFSLYETLKDIELFIKDLI